MKQLQQIQEAIETAIDSGVTQNTLAKRIGISAATLINIRRGQWSDISDRMISRIAAYFKLDDWQLRQTWNMMAVTRLCDDARTNSRFLAVAGYTGAGKSTALRYYANRNKSTYYVLATAIMTKKTFLAAIQRAMGITEGSSIQEMMQGVVSHLNSTRNPLLIIDDMGKLSHAVMRLIQIIYDETEFGCGIVIAGTEYMKEEIDRQATRNRMGFRELRRRIAYWQPLQHPSGKVVAEICESYGITDKAAIEYVIEYARDYGTLRNLVTNARGLASDRGVKINREVLDQLHVGDHLYRMVANR